MPSSPTPDKPKILILVSGYLPGYKAGGPIRSIENLVNTFADEFDFRIVAMDRDLGDSEPYPGIVTHQWVPVGGVQVMYLDDGNRGILKLCQLLRTMDRDTVLYINSFFGRQFSMLPVLLRWLRLCQPRYTVLAPRGEFSQGALGIRSRRKHFYILLSRCLGLHSGITWHASSAFESTDIQNVFPATRSISIAGVVDSTTKRPQTRSVVVTASDLASASPTKGSTRAHKTAGQLRLVFLGRCSPMKNLTGALRLLTGLSGDITMDVYGPVEDLVYWRECEALISELPSNVKVHHKGQIPHSEVSMILSQYDLFFLPTLGENYGHVIFEALSAGCPVLISDRTPWRKLEEAGVGWDVSLSDPDRFRSILTQCIQAENGEIDALSSAAKKFAHRHASNPDTLEANRQLFIRALNWSRR